MIIWDRTYHTDVHQFRCSPQCNHTDVHQFRCSPQCNHTDVHQFRCSPQCNHFIVINISGLSIISHCHCNNDVPPSSLHVIWREEFNSSKYSYFAIRGHCMLKTGCCMLNNKILSNTIIGLLVQVSFHCIPKIMKYIASSHRIYMYLMAYMLK